MTRTMLFGTAALCTVLVGGAAGAAPKPAPKPKPLCQQVQDPAGDAQLFGTNNPSGQPQVPSLDVISADFATTTKQVLIAIRLNSLASHPATALGSSYTYLWTVNGVTQSLSYRTFADSAPDAVYDADTTTGTLLDLVPASFTVAPSTSTITLSLARKNNAVLRAAKGRPAFSGLTVQTFGGVNRKNGSTLSGYDKAIQAKAYVDLTPTCLKGA